MSLLADTIIDSDWMESERSNEAESEQGSRAGKTQLEGADAIQLEWRYD